VCHNAIAAVADGKVARQTRSMVQPVDVMIVYARKQQPAPGMAASTRDRGRKSRHPHQRSQECTAAVTGLAAACLVTPSP